MASNIVGYSLVIAMTTIISIGLYILTTNYFNSISDTIQNKNLEDFAFKLYFYLNQIKYMEDNSTISYSFHSSYIFITPLKKGIYIQKRNKLDNSIYYANFSKNFDCTSETMYDPYMGTVLRKIHDGIYKASGVYETFFVCDPDINITTHSSTKSGNYFDIYFKKINKTTIEVEI